MSTGPGTDHRRALVLGGGGVTGIAWEVGVLAGLRAAGLDLASADAVIGTSAGAFVGAALASGHDLEQLVVAQSVPDPNELPAVASEEVMVAWYGAFTGGGSDRRQVGMAMGRIGRAHPSRCREPRGGRSFGPVWSPPTGRRPCRSPRSTPTPASCTCSTPLPKSRSSTPLRPAVLSLACGH